MDKSLDFIKMCGKAEEIQKLRPRLLLFFEGDYFASMGYKDRWYITLAVPNYKGKGRSIYFRTLNGSIWLPRQDQLQGIMFPSPQDSINIQCNRVANQFALEDYSNTGCTATYFFTTWEQLWLAFVLKGKYSKVWNGGEWVNNVQVSNSTRLASIKD